jgi:primosomal protein N'
MGIADIAKLWNDLVNERGSSNIQRERNVFLKERYEASVEKVKELEAKNADLENENGKLTAQLKAKTTAEEFVEHRGALFKRKPEGGYHLAVYCPHCRKSVDSPHGILPYCCTRDNWFADFDRRELERIIKELP